MIQTKIKMQLQLYRQQALLLNFSGSGPHNPHGVKSAGLSLLAKNAKPTGRKYGARGKSVYSSNKKEKMRKFCLIKGVFTHATHEFFCHGGCHVKQCDLTWKINVSCPIFLFQIKTDMTSLPEVLIGANFGPLCVELVSAWHNRS